MPARGLHARDKPRNTFTNPEPLSITNRIDRGRRNAPPKTRTGRVLSRLVSTSPPTPGVSTANGTTFDGNYLTTGEKISSTLGTSRVTYEPRSISRDLARYEIARGGVIIAQISRNAVHGSIAPPTSSLRSRSASASALARSGDHGGNKCERRSFCEAVSSISSLTLS